MVKEPKNLKDLHIFLGWELVKWLDERRLKKGYNSLTSYISYILELYRKSKEKKENG